jgi:hypothetical protein
MAGDATSTRRASRDGVEELNASEFKESSRLQPSPDLYFVHPL